MWESSQKFQAEHLAKLDELNTSQVFGQQIGGIIFPINKVEGDKASINDFTLNYPLS